MLLHSKETTGIQAALSDWLFSGKLEHFSAIWAEQNTKDDDRGSKLSNFCIYSLPGEQGHSITLGVSTERSQAMGLLLPMLVVGWREPSSVQKPQRYTNMVQDIS